jgi:uncharacterized membrane protein YjjP (DUF1212 family)
MLRRRGVQDVGAPFRAPFSGIVPVFAIAVIGWLLASLSADEWKGVLVVVVVAIVVYATSLPSRRARHLTMAKVSNAETSA